MQVGRLKIVNESRWWRRDSFQRLARTLILRRIPFLVSRILEIVAEPHDCTTTNDEKYSASWKHTVNRIFSHPRSSFLSSSLYFALSIQPNLCFVSVELFELIKRKLNFHA